jgi:hypothetical protein
MNESRREIPRYNKDGTRAKKDWVQRQCQVCNQWVGSTKLSVDHIDPVVSVEDGFIDWNQFIDRVWCPKSNLQRICDTCHNAKTNAERIARLTKQYTKELDEIEIQVNISDDHRNLYGGTGAFKTMIKSLNKYIAKKKTKGLEQIVERASKLKERVQIYKATYDNT